MRNPNGNFQWEFPMKNRDKILTTNISIICIYKYLYFIKWILKSWELFFFFVNFMRTFFHYFKWDTWRMVLVILRTPGLKPLGHHSMLVLQKRSNHGSKRWTFWILRLSCYCYFCCIVHVRLATQTSNY